MDCEVSGMTIIPHNETGCPRCGGTLRLLGERVKTTEEAWAKCERELGKARLEIMKLRLRVRALEKQVVQLSPVTDS